MSMAASRRATWNLHVSTVREWMADRILKRVRPLFLWQQPDRDAKPDINLNGPFRSVHLPEENGDR